MKAVPTASSGGYVWVTESRTQEIPAGAGNGYKNCCEQVQHRGCGEPPRHYPRVDSQRKIEHFKYEDLL